MTLVFAPNIPEAAVSNDTPDLLVRSVPTVGEVRSWFRQLAAVDLKELEERFVHAVQRNAAGEGRADGFPSGRPGSGGMDSGTSTETAGLSSYRLDTPEDVDNSPGAWLDDLDRLDSVEKNLLHAADRLWAAVADLGSVVRRMKLDEHLATHTPAYDPSGNCRACDRWVAGTANDRLRAGYCDACRKAWERAGRPERVAFERDRRAQLSAGQRR